jgi:type VI secretion system secreted protein VgrG
VISGTPTRPGTSTFTVTATNATTPAVSAMYTVAVRALTPALAAPALALTGVNSAPALTLGSILLISGGLLFASRRRRFRAGQ